LRHERTVGEPNPHLQMSIQSSAYRVAAAQLVAAATISLVLLWFSGAATAGAAFAGGLIAAAGTLYFARSLAGATGRSPREFARAFVVGEGLKVVLTVALFRVALALFEATPAPLFITYAATLMVYWLALLPGMSGAGQQQGH